MQRDYFALFFVLKVTTEPASRKLSNPTLFLDMDRDLIQVTDILSHIHYTIGYPLHTEKQMTLLTSLLNTDVNRKYLHVKDELNTLLLRASLDVFTAIIPWDSSKVQSPPNSSWFTMFICRGRQTRQYASYSWKKERNLLHFSGIIFKIFQSRKHILHSPVSYFSIKKDLSWQKDCWNLNYCIWIIHFYISLRYYCSAANRAYKSYISLFLI